MHTFLLLWFSVLLIGVVIALNYLNGQVRDLYASVRLHAEHMVRMDRRVSQVLEAVRERYQKLDNKTDDIVAMFSARGFDKEHPLVP